MKKASIVLALAGFLALCAMPVFAGGISDQIILNSQTNAGGGFTFHGSSGAAFSSITLATTLGSASGQGALTINNANDGTNSGYYTIQNANGGTMITNGGSGCNGTCTLLNQSNSQGILFDLGSSNMKGSNDLLTGYLTLQDVSQSGKTGTFNNNLMVNLVITGGSMQSLFAGSNGIVQLFLTINSGLHSIYNMPSTGTLVSPLHGGTINSTLPEPSSLALLGSGLISLGGLMMRFKLRQNA
jgi:hypothetical protein